jgi:peptidyl-dipeptidase A
MSSALGKIAFLPFRLLIEQWRWQAFSGAVPPERYNQAWWDLRLKCQGIAPPTPRGDMFFGLLRRICGSPPQETEGF